jgi:predicted ATP-grasp superfamily ATP-dependent carboligase
LIMPKVLVLDGKSIATVSIVRSLGRKGIYVACGEEYKSCPGLLSKYVKTRIVYPSPAKTPDLFLEKIFSLTRNGEYDLVIPVSDETSVLLSKHKTELSNFTKIPTPSYETMMVARDKASTMKVAIENGIPCPETYFPEEIPVENIRDLARYPVVIKPRESSGARGIRYVASAEKIEADYQMVKAKYGKAYIQEYIPNTQHYSICVLMNLKSERRASFSYQEIRQFPVTGGSAAYAISVKKPDLIEYATSLLRKIKWTGVANLEFVIDERDNTPKLIEINPRFWMSLELAVQSGVDFPYLLFRQMMDGDIKSSDDFRLGVKYRWLVPADILWLWNSRNKISAYSSFFKLFEHDLHYAVFSPGDLGPSMGVLLQSLRYLASRETRDYIFKRGW